MGKLVSHLSISCIDWCRHWTNGQTSFPNDQDPKLAKNVCFPSAVKHFPNWLKTVWQRSLRVCHNNLMQRDYCNTDFQPKKRDVWCTQSCQNLGEGFRQKMKTDFWHDKLIPIWCARTMQFPWPLLDRGTARMRFNDTLEPACKVRVLSNENWP